MIAINSYTDINGVPFGAGKTEVISVFGKPANQTKNREREEEFHFTDFILRFDASTNRLREASLLPGCKGTINGSPVLWDRRFLSWLAAEDEDLQEVLGFVLSLKLGLALSGFHDDDDSQKAIHAFRFGDWDMFKNRMRPFKP
jgi:hypothetical protein